LKMAARKPLSAALGITVTPLYGFHL
jgi:hypothetical protein